MAHEDPRPFFVYILANADRGVLYTGVTNDLLRRTHEHRTHVVPGFTDRYNLTRLVWYEVHGEVGPAIAREKRIKRWRREWKVALVEERNPDWLDLYDEITGQWLPPK